MTKKFHVDTQMDVSTFNLLVPFPGVVVAGRKREVGVDAGIAPGLVGLSNKAEGALLVGLDGSLDLQGVSLLVLLGHLLDQVTKALLSFKSGLLAVHQRGLLDSDV